MRIIDKKQKFVEMQQIARERCGGVRSTEYVNARTNMRWVCHEGHEWEATPSNIKQGSWCPRCDTGNISLTYEVIQQEADERGGGCKSTEYINSSTKMWFWCIEGHEWEATPFNVIHRNSWCPYCAERVPLTLTKLQQVARDQGGSCLATEYVNNCTNVRWRCAEGHEWEATPASVKDNGTWCPYCAKKAPLTLEILRQLANIHRGWCLATEYINSYTKVRWRCAEGHEWEATPNHVRNYGRWCPFCHNKSENAVRTMLKYALELDFLPHSPKALKSQGIELRNTADNLMHLDGFNIDICAAFEYHGLQHTDGGSYFYRYNPESFLSRQKDDELKREQCERLGIVLFEVYEEQHGAWPHLNRLYSGLLNVLEKKGIHVTGKPNLSDSAWMGLISRDREQTTLMRYSQSHIISEEI